MLAFSFHSKMIGFNKARRVYSKERSVIKHCHSLAAKDGYQKLLARSNPFLGSSICSFRDLLVALEQSNKEITGVGRVLTRPRYSTGWMAVCQLKVSCAKLQRHESPCKCSITGVRSNSSCARVWFCTAVPERVQAVEKRHKRHRGPKSRGGHADIG